MFKVKIKVKIVSIYYICILIWIFSSVVFGRSTIKSFFNISSNALYINGRLLVYIFLLIIIFHSGYKIKELIYGGIVLFITVLSSLLTGERVILSIVFFVLASKNTNKEDILKYFLIGSIFATGIILLLSMTGKIDTNMVYRGLTVRNSFGFSHPNGLGNEISLITICYFTIRWEKIKNIELILGTIMMSIIFALSDSRTSIIIFLIFVLVSFMVKNNFIKNSVKVIYIVANITLVVMVFISLFMMFFYNSDNKVISLLNSVLSGRFYMLHVEYLRCGISLLGVRMDDSQLSIALDNSYGRVLIVNGILILLILIIFCITVIRIFYIHQDVALLIVFICILINGTMENGLFRIESNFAFLIGGNYLLKGFIQKHDLSYL